MSQPKKRPTRRGFTLIDLMLAACILTILMFLAVSLSRHVRAQSARGLTSDLLARLEMMVAQYSARHEGAVPAVTPLLQTESPGPGATGDEGRVQISAIRNNRDFLRAFASSGEKLTGGPSLPPAGAASEVGREHGGGARGDTGGWAITTDSPLPASVYDPAGPSLRDAWGTPIVFLSRQHPAFGMAPRDAPFFLSAGPDRKFLTRADNLYSYEAFPQSLP